MFGPVFFCSRVILGSQLLTLIVKDANVAEQWAVNSAGECHVDIVEVGSSILPSPTKAYSIPDKELDRPFFFARYPQKQGWALNWALKILKFLLRNVLEVIFHCGKI